MFYLFVFSSEMYAYKLVKLVKYVDYFNLIIKFILINLLLNQSRNSTNGFLNLLRYSLEIDWVARRALRRSK